jgi:hypothetical protein
MFNIMSILVIALMLIGCGQDGSQGPSGPQGPTGEQGVPGDNGQDALVMYEFEVDAQCTEVSSDLYIQKQGSKVHVYNNADCDSDPDLNKRLCKLLNNNFCWVGNRLLSAYDDGDLVLRLIIFN